MPAPLKLTCFECSSINRVPAERMNAGPKCGTCGTKLTDGKLRAIDPATLSRLCKTDSMPVVVDFWAPWCGPCRTMTPAVTQAARNLAGHVRFAKLNTEDHPKVAAKHNIRGIPALILFKNGKELGRHAGAMPARRIEAFIQQHIK